MSTTRLFQGTLADWLGPRVNEKGQCTSHWRQTALPPFATDSLQWLGMPVADPTERPLIVIDVGHGHYRGPNGERVHDKGARGTLDGKRYDEHTIALQVAQRLKPLLEANGFDVLLTQTGDGTPLANRFQARLDAGRNDPDKVMHMVLHANASESPSVRGFAAMYHRDVPGGAGSQSARWAQALEREFPVLSRADGPTHNTSLLQPGTYTSPNHASWSITQGLGSLPAVLVEMGYMTNRPDLQELASAQGQQRIAERLVRATVQHYDSMHREGAVRLARSNVVPSWPIPTRDDMGIATALLLKPEAPLLPDARNNLSELFQPRPHFPSRER